MKRYLSLRRALSLVEILGAVAVISVVAYVSIMSVKDTLTASQRSAIQKELQSLNTALNNFKAAGGVIPDGVTTSAALDKLQDGTPLGGAGYSPLTSLPDMSKTIAGTPYTLAYDPTAGFLMCRPAKLLMMCLQMRELPMALGQMEKLTLLI